MPQNPLQKDMIKRLAIFACVGAMSLSGIHAAAAFFPASGVSGPSASEQRRARPSSMKHTEAEVKNVSKVTHLKGKYIRDGVTFNGSVYMTGDAGAINVGKATIHFAAGKYTLSYGAENFEMRTSMSREERRRKGITDYEYDHSWKNEKLGNDFSHSGKYEVVKQFDKIHLILYDGDTKDVFAKIPLASAADSSFEFQEDDVLMRMSAQ